MTNIESFYYLVSFSLWMGWNVCLALVAVRLGHLVQKTKSSLVRILTLPFWLLFLPNTLYMVTDVIHVYGGGFARLTTPFVLLGIVVVATVIALAVYTFYHAVIPVMRGYVRELLSMPWAIRTMLFVFLSALVGIAVTMGRFQRTNSWFVFTQPIKVIEDLMYSLSHVDSMYYAFIVTCSTFVLINLFWNHLRQLSTKRG